MKISPTINVRTDKLSGGFLSAVEFCKELMPAVDGDRVSLSNVRFVTPSFLLPSLVFIEKMDRKPEFTDASSYLNAMSFCSGGIDASSMRDSEFKGFISGFAGGSYIPIIKFPTDLNGLDKRDAILSSVHSILVRQSKFGHNVENGLRYIIGESVDNIVEHSRSKYGYITAQSYPDKGYTDICIADTGGTILGSYADNPRTAGIESDIEAIQSAVSGISAKNLPEAENRGYGLRTTIGMLTKGLDGEYLLASGDALFAATGKASQFIELPWGMRFCGTVIAFRIPENMTNFNYMKYIA